MAKGDINISRIAVDGVGGLGLLAMAAIVIYLVPPLRAGGVPTVLGGVVGGLTLIAIRNPRMRTVAVVGALLAASALVFSVLRLLRS